MRTLVLILISVLMLLAGNAGAASYQRTDGTIVDPILDTSGNAHPYNLVSSDPLTGLNLEPYQDLTGAELNNASLQAADLKGAFLVASRFRDADLSAASFESAQLDGSILSGANLSGTFLSQASLFGADLGRANLTNAILANAFGLPSTTGSPFYNANTDFTGTGFDPVAAGWTLVPEPSTALLMGLGLAGLASRRR